VNRRFLLFKRRAVTARPGNLRVSPHFYNNEFDLARLADALTDNRRASA
jgi:selenocysteine lyase/cysteine desulfurase